MTNKLTRMSVLTAAALILHIVEAQLPPLVPIPGVKLGLANIITVYAIFRFTPKETFMILFVRILLGSIFAGSLTALLFSACGGLFCYLCMLIMRKIVNEKQIWVCSVFGSAAHNTGQMLAALALYQSYSVLVYLPLLMLSGIICGLFTGLCVQAVIKRLDGIL